jgi:hypothetical protein
VHLLEALAVHLLADDRARCCGNTIQPSGSQVNMPGARGGCSRRAPAACGWHLRVGGVLAQGAEEQVVDIAGAPARKLKKGKAKFKLPTELAVGKYRIKAKVKGKKISAKKKFTVYSGGIQPNATAFTYSMSTGELFNYSGTVTWKGKPGSTGGWVDIYKAPYTKGISGPDYLCMDAIEEGGTFDFTYKSCFTDFVPGTYEVRAFYTPTAGSSADDYLIGTPITVTIVP